MTKGRGSTSSRGASDDEMNCQSTGEFSEGSLRRELKVCIGKRKSEETSYGETTEDLEEEKKAGASKRKTKEDRMMIEAKRSRQGEMEERRMEERKRNSQTERKGCNSNNMSEDDITKIKRMKDGLTAIMNAAMKENGGRVAVTRADQTTVRDAVFMLQHELLDFVVRQMELERENARLRGLADGKSAGKARRVEGGKSGRVVSRDSTDSENEWQETGKLPELGKPNPKFRGLANWLQERREKVLLAGDFNGKNSMWGGNVTDDRGKRYWTGR